MTKHYGSCNVKFIQLVNIFSPSTNSNIRLKNKITSGRIES